MSSITGSTGKKIQLNLRKYKTAKLTDLSRDINTFFSACGATGFIIATLYMHIPTSSAKIMTT
jgi:hypothetical protein